MFVGRRLKFSFIWFFGAKNILQATALSTLVYLAYEWLNIKFIDIPFLLVSTVGTAVAFYVGFKNNSSYDRLWEARKIWGAIVNVSRTFAVFTLNTVGDAAKIQHYNEIKTIHRELIYRHIAWINVLRLQLRRPLYWNGTNEDNLPHLEYVAMTQETETFDNRVRDYLLEFTSEVEFADDKGKGNIASLLLNKQTERFSELKRADLLDPFEHQQLILLIRECFDQQGAAERIKNYPFPRFYALFSDLFVKIFTFMLPFGLIAEMSKLGIGASWLIIPLCTLIAWIYNTMEQIGDTSENPFENAVNDVPMSSICRNIEIDLRELLGETKLPERIKAVDDVLL